MQRCGSLLAHKYIEVCEGAADFAVSRKFSVLGLDALYPSGTSPLSVMPLPTE